jgi:hypothetical protein
MKKNSQNQEEKKIFKIIKLFKKNKINDNWCCEFGAWDGVHLSNSFFLIKELNYKAILIEPNKKKYRQLLKNHPNTEIVKLNLEVNFANNTLNKIFSKTQIPRNFDFLSIDVDGNDYHFFKELNYEPKLVCCEFTETIPNDVLFVQNRVPGLSQGCSALSLISMAKKKKYSLIDIEGGNLFFLQNKYLNLLGLKEKILKDLRNDENIKNYFYVLPDAKIILTKPKVKILWHDNFILDFTKKIQIFPKFLQKHSTTYNFYEKITYLFYLMLYDFSTFKKKIKRFIKNINKLNRRIK